MSVERSKETLHNNEEINPCIGEANWSYECLSRSGYDKQKCSIAFENVKECKRFWSSVKIKRRQQGIKPYMPGSVERKQIIDYLDDKLPYVAAAKHPDKLL